MKKLIESVKCFFIAWLFSKEIEEEEFGYYALYSYRDFTNPLIEWVVDKVFRRFGLLKKDYESFGECGNSYLHIYSLPPSKWKVGITVMSEVKKYKNLKKMWYNRRRNLQRRKR